ncbi:WASH complex subunit 2 isoform X2 [Centroberyx gerrardi]
MSGLPDGMANGPRQSEHLGKDAQVWERPWTLEEMRQTSANWSLAADSGLFLFLQDFSQRMLSKTHEIEKQLDSLIRDTKATDSCLHSVFNDFLMLSNTQFIENRVYDEEVEEPVPKAEALEKQPEQEKTREQKEAELIPKMQEAVNYGLRVLDSAFEQLDIKAGNSDSEDEETTDRVEAILEPKDLYVDRPLPYLIGSQAFMEQDDVGLGDLSSDEMSIDSDRDSVIESDDGKEAVHSDEDFDQEEEGHGSIKKKSSMLSYEDDEEEDEDSDIFGESDKEDDDDDDDKRNTGSSSFADELAARIKGEPVSKPEGDRTSLTSKKKSKGKKEPKPARPLAAEDDSDDMFKPPKMDDDDFSPFGGKGGLFSGGRGLFDDEDEGDLFSEAPKPPASEEKKAMHESTKSTAHTAESGKPGKKIPPGAVSIFPDNSLFSSGNDSDSVESKENGTPVKPKTRAAPKQAPTGGGGGAAAGGLFDDEEEDDDFFSGKSLKKSSSAGQEKFKPKKAIDLFDEDDEDGDIFNESYSAPPPAQSKKEVVEEQAKPPEKKMPAGAISMFGPGTKNLLTEGLKKRQPSTSEESEKSEENGPAPDVGKASTKQTQKLQTRGLFSDDEDAQIFPTIPKSQSKPEPTSQGKIGKASLSIFDDEEEEDLFASAAKSKPKPNQAKASTPQPKKTVSSSLFSDDEDQWIGSKPSTGKPETKAGGMKPSASAPSSLPSAKTPPQGSSLFDDDEDDLFATTKESSQKKPQRVALLFEDEGDDDEDKGSLFGIKPAVGTNTAAPAAKSTVVASQSPSLFDTEQPEEAAASRRAAEDKPSEQEKPAVKSPEAQLPSSPSESSETKKKPVGAVSLFGGIDVLASKQTKSPLDEIDGDGDFLSKDSPPPDVKKEEKKEEKVKPNTVSLFDEEEEEEDDTDWNDPIFIPSKSTARNTLKPTEERPRTKSTGVFQDEELLFSQTQQKDNDPDVDLFATSGKAAVSQTDMLSSAKLSSVKPAAPSLFADDDEDDLFSSIKPKALPPKVAEKPSKPNSEAPLKAASSESTPESEKPASSPVKPRDPSSRIGKLQANLVINPSALLPGAVPRIPGAVSVLPGLAPGSSSGVSSSSLSPSPVTTPVGPHTDSEGGVSFDTPVQVTALQSTNKSRAKGSVRRRPQSRAARQQAAQGSVEDKEESVGEDTPGQNPSLSALVLPSPGQSAQILASPTLPNSTSTTAFPVSSPPQSSFPEISPRPSVLTLPVSTNPGKKDSRKGSSNRQVLPSPDEDDLFGSSSVFGGASVTKHTTPSSRHTTTTAQDQADSGTTLKKDKEKNTLPSIFDDHGDDLFQKVKPRAATKKAKASSFMEEDNDDEEDIFGVSNSSTPTSTASKDTKSSSSFSKQDIFQDEVATVPKVHKKHKEKPIDASLFDDNVDIFADLTATSRPKEKSKKKGETKSIFDDDMDDIFSSSTTKPVTKAPKKSKKTSPSQDTSATADSGNIFDDPLNALGGN